MNALNNVIKEQLKIDYIKLYMFAKTASRRYRIYKIPKRNGKKRTIYHPSRELKKYQKFICQYILSEYPIHNKVYSYKKHTSIKDLANLHKDNNYLLRVDFKDFFPSLGAKDIREYLNKNTQYSKYNLNDNDITLLNLLVCRNDKLTIGAPSSPLLSNILLYDFDEKMDTYSNDITYSRYADDLYFSTNKPNILKTVLPFINDVLSKFPIKLTINHDKTISTSKKHRKNITGLTITTDNKISIGRKQKRYIKSLIFKFIKNQLSIEEISYLKGYLSYIGSVEKEFINRIKVKYGDDIIDKLKA